MMKRGALTFKGDKKPKKAKKKKSKAKHERKSKNEEDAVAAVAAAAAAMDDDDLTEAERKAQRRKQERELEDMKKVASKSHRERVEAFNEQLSTLTEHNDIPRVGYIVAALMGIVLLTSCHRVRHDMLYERYKGWLSHYQYKPTNNTFFLFLLHYYVQVSAAGNG